MAKIYLSYTRNDRELASTLAREIRSLGHDVFIDADIAHPGSDWRDALNNALREADALVVLLSEKSQSSPFVMAEIGSARAFAAESDRMIVLPVIVDEIPIPDVIRDILAIVSPERDWKYIAATIDRAVNNFVGRREAKKIKKEEVSDRIQKNSSEFIESAISEQSKSGRMNWILATTWYLFGFSCLLGGLIFAATHLSASIYAENNINWPLFAIFSVRAIVVVGLLGACSRYAFMLGKSHASEALKSSDRVHAIRFGKFYLESYGDQATWPETKEALQHWNIDRDSAFSSQNSNDIDPKIIDIVTEALKAAASKISTKE